MKKQVLLGLSGGVDSTVAGILLEEKNIRIKTVFMQNWSDMTVPGIEAQCPNKRELSDARKIASARGWDFSVVNFENKYGKTVWNDMIELYKKGYTPNPDIGCNRYIKFGAFANMREQYECDFMATGHYAQQKEYEGVPLIHSCPYRKNATGILENPKDQSYFLSRIPAENIQYTLFPIGTYAKEHVRQIAKKHETPNADKKDSQGICFVGHVAMETFLKQQIGIKPGDILDENHRIIGKHEGVHLFTIGQRKGIKIPNTEAYYVSARNIDANTVTVVQGKEHPALYKTVITATNLISYHSNCKTGTCVLFRIRHNQPFSSGVISECADGSISVTADNPQFAPASGQIIAVYTDTGTEAALIGSGIINETLCA